MGLVNDYSNVLDQSTRHRLESNLDRFRQQCGIEFLVVFVDTKGSQSIGEYSKALINVWGLTPEEQSKGELLLLIAMNDHEWHTEVGRPLWADLPDKTMIELGEIINDSFSEGKYGEGVTRYVEAIISRLTKMKG